jgi:hypothetical protein
MSVIIQGYQLRTVAFGVQLIKAATALPQSSGVSSTLATVNNGAILVTSMVGKVSTVITGTTTTLEIGTAPTVGAAAPAGIAGATAITSAAVGTWMVPLVSAGVGGLLVVGASPGNAVFLPTPFVVPAGTITLQCSSAAPTGAISWYFTYVPLDNGASLS